SRLSGRFFAPGAICFVHVLIHPYHDACAFCTGAPGPDAFRLTSQRESPLMHRPLARTLAFFASVCLLTRAAFAAPVELDPPAAAASSDASSIVDVSVTAGASGAPNGFTVEWMTRILFDQL